MRGALDTCDSDHVHRHIAALVLSAAGCSGIAQRAAAQHATAFDVEDGARSFASYCAACHGPDGNLIPGIDLGRGQFRRPHTDEELADIIMNGKPGTAMPATPRLSEDGVQRLVAYLRATAVAHEDVAAGGDAARGKALFDGQGKCADCHRVDGNGARVGPDLSSVGRELRAARFGSRCSTRAQRCCRRTASIVWSRRTARRFGGGLLNHDTFTVQLLDTDEHLRSFVKASLKDYGFEDTPMPSYKDKLSAEQIADLVSYLVTLQAAP